MAKIITFNYKDKDYTLEYTRRTVVEMEGKGFSVNEVPKKPLTMLPELFAGAFLAHHRDVKRETIDEIFENLSNKQELVECLAEMYVEPLEALFAAPAEQGNSGWKMNE